MSSNFIAAPRHSSISDSDMMERATTFRKSVEKRRTIRHFASTPVPRGVIDECLLAANSAPSGANLQPWHFVVVSDPETKNKIRLAAEEEEREFYARRATKEWLEALAPLGVDEHKPFLETAPYLIAVFVQNYSLQEDGSRTKHYYATESVGLATGILITALHHAGLATLTHTPSPMAFLSKILDRPSNERPFLLLVVGHPDEDAVVPDIRRRGLAEIATYR
jgi:iodotyrosine deiodinase